MDCVDCKGTGKSANEGQGCFVCNGTGLMCDVCGEAIDVCDGCLEHEPQPTDL